LSVESLPASTLFHAEFLDGEDFVVHILAVRQWPATAALQRNLLLQQPSHEASRGRQSQRREQSLTRMAGSNRAMHIGSAEDRPAEAEELYRRRFAQPPLCRADGSEEFGESI
jgi:hypothetical protein